jgi:hypothetical protein
LVDFDSAKVGDTVFLVLACGHIFCDKCAETGGALKQGTIKCTECGEHQQYQPFSGYDNAPAVVKELLKPAVETLDSVVTHLKIQMQGYEHLASRLREKVLEQKGIIAGLKDKCSLMAQMQGELERAHERIRQLERRDAITPTKAGNNRSNYANIEVDVPKVNVHNPFFRLNTPISGHNANVETTRKPFRELPQVSRPGTAVMSHQRFSSRPPSNAGRFQTPITSRKPFQRPGTSQTHRPPSAYRNRF